LDDDNGDDGDKEEEEEEEEGESSSIGAVDASVNGGDGEVDVAEFGSSFCPT